MKTIQEAIENITYFHKEFPAEAFRFISDHPEEAKPYLHEAIDCAVKKDVDFDDNDNDNLPFYALFFLGEFQDRDFFEQIILFCKLPSETLEYFIGDAITESLRDILYNTYNGNLQLLKDTIKNPEVDPYVRMDMLDVIAQLYLDQQISREEWQGYLRELIVIAESLGCELCSEITGMICKCHFVDMRSEVYTLLAEGLADADMYGDYDSCIDIMFEYRREEKFCNSQVSVENLKTWAMFTEENPGREITDTEREKAFRKFMKEYQQANRTIKKIGRNDPCPCGSGRKYKHCCLNKPKTGLDQIESLAERQKWLRYYPETGVGRQEGREYLEDYYDAESIEIDRLVYLALKQRVTPIWEKNRAWEKEEERRKTAYLWEAFPKFVDKCQKNNITDADQYNEKYSIHYMCEYSLLELMDLLYENGENEQFQQVLEFNKKLGILEI